MSSETVTIRREVLERWLDDLYCVTGSDKRGDSAVSGVRREMLKLIDSTAPTSLAQTGLCRTDGRCQYAIDHGAEGMGHCPKGAYVMPDSGSPPAVTQTVDNPWREFIENCISGDNYFRASEYRELLADLDRLYVPALKPLTDDEIETLYAQTSDDPSRERIEFARLIERHHKIGITGE